MCYPDVLFVCAAVLWPSKQKRHVKPVSHTVPWHAAGSLQVLFSHQLLTNALLNQLKRGKGLHKRKCWK